MKRLYYQQQIFSFKSILLLLMCLVATSLVRGQDMIPFNSDQWEYNGEYTIEDYKGAQALVLAPGTTAYLPGVSMQNGVIEYDVAFSRQRGFVFTFFRLVDEANYEEFYFRPHQSGNPDAMQYTPVFNRLNGWQLYHGANHSTEYEYKDNEWMHIKMVIKDSRMELFIDNMNIPVLDVFELKRDPVAGSIGFASAMTEARIANVTIIQPDNIQFINTTTEIPVPGPEVVSSWEVSTAFSGDRLGLEFDQKLNKELTWSEMPIEYSGVVNLAKVGVLQEGGNTVFARFRVRSEASQRKQLEFGYSDAARIYVNGKAVYEGQRLFRSRDYRYLGTIGFFDSVFLDLQQGENEIVFAVSENFGGWGVMARFADLEQIKGF